jgi:hypothetical protein
MISEVIPDNESNPFIGGSDFNDDGRVRSAVVSGKVLVEAFVLASWTKHPLDGWARRRKARKIVQ